RACPRGRDGGQRWRAVKTWRGTRPAGVVQFGAESPSRAACCAAVMLRTGGDMDQDSIIHYIVEALTEVTVVRPSASPGAGDTLCHYDPQHDLETKPRLPFATIVTKDYADFDNASALHRPEVFRLNIGVSRATFRALFGHLPNEDPGENSNYDFTALDRL